MKFLIKSKKTELEWSISSTSGVNVGPIKNTDASLLVEVSSVPFTPRLANLVVQVKNEGKFELNNFYIMASVSDGYSLNNPGELFGTSMRMEKVKKLLPTQNMKFKLTLRGTVITSGAFLNVLLSSTPNDSDPEAIKVTVELNAITNK